MGWLMSSKGWKIITARRYKQFKEVDGSKKEDFEGDVPFYFDGPINVAAEDGGRKKFFYYVQRKKAKEVCGVDWCGGREGLVHLTDCAYLLSSLLFKTDSRVVIHFG